MSNGPYLTAALICDQVIEGKDGVLSAIRIVDQLNCTAIAAPTDGHPVTVSMSAGGRISPVLQFSFLIVLKSGDFRGRGKVRLGGLSPSGKRVAEREVEVELLGENYGANVIVSVAMPSVEPGIHWFEVYFDDKLLTKSPLSIRLEQSVPQTKNEKQEH